MVNLIVQLAMEDTGKTTLWLLGYFPELWF
jgi:hypothetical protein